MVRFSLCNKSLSNLLKTVSSIEKDTKCTFMQLTSETLVRIELTNTSSDNLVNTIKKLLSFFSTVSGRLKGREVTTDIFKSYPVAQSESCFTKKRQQ